VSELKVKPMKPRTQPADEAVAEEKSAQGADEALSSNGATAPALASGAKDEKIEASPRELRAEHEHRQQEQRSRVRDIEPEKLRRMLYQMILCRRFEEKAAESYTLGKIGGFCHLYIGQEAVAVGAINALRPTDYVITSYRDHAHALVCGTPPDEVMAELFGKASGCSAGKGGSMHLFDVARHFMGGHAIVGGQIPLATGLAFAAKYKNTDQVTLCTFGEAAVNQGVFHESLNMAQLWKLPCIYMCENNQYGMGTSLQRAMSLQDVSKKGAAYDMVSEFVDGMDVLAVYDATKRAAERARKDGSPTLIEVRTYRYMGHSMSDPGNYRTRAEIEKYQERDPIKVFTDSLKNEKIIDDAAVKEIEAKVKAEIEHAVKFADESSLPAPEELYTDVYAN
jgi:pyruvate dehydrogenase E1 component alpha subunit